MILGKLSRNLVVTSLFIPVDELSHICQLARPRLGLGGREGRQQQGGAGRHAVACSHGVSLAFLKLNAKLEMVKLDNSDHKAMITCDRWPG